MPLSGSKSEQFTKPVESWIEDHIAQGSNLRNRIRFERGFGSATKAILDFATKESVDAIVMSVTRLDPVMKAIRIHKYGDANQLKLEEAPNLTILDDQVIVKIRDAGVNPIDWKIRAGYLKNRMLAAFPLTIGQDFSGEVVERGKHVDGFMLCRTFKLDCTSAHFSGSFLVVMGARGSA